MTRRPSRWQIEHDIEAHKGDDERAAKQRDAMLVKPLVFCEDDYPPIASPQDEQEVRW